MSLPDPQETPTLSVEEAGRLLGLSRNKAYDESNRYLHTDGAEGIPTLRFGRVMRCPTAAILRLLGTPEAELDDNVTPIGG